MMSISGTVRTKEQRKAASRRAFLHFKRSWQMYVLFFLPLLYFVIFKYGAFFWMSIAFKDYSVMDGLWGSEWVGFKYFNMFLQDPYFWKLIRNTILLNLCMLVFYFPFPIILALMINEVRVKQFRKFVQTVSYLPYFFSTVVICGLVVNFLATEGMVNNLIAALGGNRIQFMTSPEWFRPVYVISEIWQNAGWGSIIYLAALSGVDTELYEAAVIDGVNRWQQMRRISLPSIAPVISIQFLLTVGQLLTIGYEKVLLLYNGSTRETADVISTYIYRRGLIAAEYSYGAAVNIFQAVLALILICAANKAAARIGSTSLW